VAAWIAGFDVIYALLDVEFDRAHGVHSIPAAFGRARALGISGFLHVATVLLLVAAGLAVGAGLIYFAGVAICAAILLIENRSVVRGGDERVMTAFGVANGVLALVFFGFVLAEVIVS
jgi:4-hydroxybenzoate polyprenyltransferase